MASEQSRPKNPVEWVESLGLRGAIAHLAEIVYDTVYSGGEKPWQESTGKIEKPQGNYEKPGGWGANPDPAGWGIITMRDDPSLFKIVDAHNINVAHKFPSREVAQQYIDWARQEYKKPSPPSPPSPDGELEDGVKMFYRRIGDPTRFVFKSSNPGRAQYVADLPKPLINMEISGYLKINAVTNQGEEVSIKSKGGPHSDSDREAGSCYICGVGYDGTINCQYEQPHPSNHRMPLHEQKGQFDPSPVVGRFLGIKNIVYYDKEKDIDVLKLYIDPDGLNQEGKPSNNWKLFYETTSKQFAGIENSNGDPKVFFRCDDVAGDPKANSELKFATVREISV